MRWYVAVIMGALLATIVRLTALWGIALPFLAAADTLPRRAMVYTLLEGVSMIVFGCVVVFLLRGEFQKSVEEGQDAP